MYSSIHAIYRKLPPNWRTGLKRTLNTEGHGEGKLDWLTARKDATGKKRLDRAIAGVSDALGADIANKVAGKVCVDFGSGYVPTDGLALWLLGAKEVYGVDYNHIAKPHEIARAVRTADQRAVEGHFQQLNLVFNWQERMQTLQDWARHPRGQFPPGYTYAAPVDVIATPNRLPEFDILLSTSVLEHIQPSQLPNLLDSLKSRENPGGLQIHRVDLRDHRDFERNPYGFLDPVNKFDSENEADSRGNGMTLPDWEAILTSHPEWRLSIVDFEAGKPELLPAGTPPARVAVLADSLVLRTNSAPT